MGEFDAILLRQAARRDSLTAHLGGHESDLHELHMMERKPRWTRWTCLKCSKSLETGVAVTAPPTCCGKAMREVKQ